MPAGDLGFWQGTFRDPADPLFAETAAAVKAGRSMTVDLLYGDHEGGQRTISRFTLIPRPDGRWLVAVSRHWNLDRDGPRRPTASRRCGFDSAPGHWSEVAVCRAGVSHAPT